MKIIESEIFRLHPELIFGISTKNEQLSSPPFYFNMSLSVGDERNMVVKNREAFFKELGLQTDQVATQNQIHSDIITIVTKPANVGESDAMITNRPNIGLAISMADCVGIFIYDPACKIIAGIHSGWRGTQQRILEKTLNKLKTDFQSFPNDLKVYLAPSICQAHYEVDKEVANNFNPKYLIPNGNKFLLDVANINYDFLINFGVNKQNIEVSSLCTYEEIELLFSYRRDGSISGRSFGVIALKGDY
jgi:hypothetical protein